MAPWRTPLYSKSGCDQCRARKKKCDEVKPICSACVRLHLQCSWNGGKRLEPQTWDLRLDLASQQSTNLRSRDWLQQARRNSRQKVIAGKSDARDAAKAAENSEQSMGLVVTQHPYSNLPVQEERLTHLCKKNGLCPAMRSFLELELHTRYKVAYPTYHPANAFFANENDDMGSEFRCSDLISRYERMRLEQLIRCDSHESPLQAPLYSESLLHMQIRQWTRIDVDDHFAERIFSAYFETEHHLIGLLDAEQFISDLASKPTPFCSPLLVNSLLFYACKRFSCVDSRAPRLSSLFFAEAKCIWKSLQHRSSVTDVAAFHFLSAGRAIDLEDDASSLFTEALNIADEYQLYGAASQWYNLTGFASNQEKTAYTFAAWGSFGCCVYRSFFDNLKSLRDLPLLPIPKARRLPTSLEDQNRKTGHGTSYDNIFPAVCRFWTIIRDAILARRFPVSIRDSARSIYDEMVYRRLLQWTETLPRNFSQTAEMSGPVAILWSWFHLATMKIFLPSAENRNQGFSTFSALDGSPKTAVDVSFKQLTRVVLSYRAEHTEIRLTLMWMDSLYQCSKTLIRDYRGLDSPMLFYHCLLGLSELMKCFHSAEALLRDILLLAVKHGCLEMDTAEKIIVEARKGSRLHSSSDSPRLDTEGLRRAAGMFKYSNNSVDH